MTKSLDEAKKTYGLVILFDISKKFRLDVCENFIILSDCGMCEKAT